MKEPTQEDRKLLRAIEHRRKEIAKVQTLLENPSYSARIITAYQSILRGHEIVLAKLLAAAPEKVTAKGEAE